MRRSPYHLAGICLCMFLYNCSRLDESRGKLNQELRLESQEILSGIQKMEVALDSIFAQHQAWLTELDTLPQALNPIQQEHQLSLSEFGELLQQKKAEVQKGRGRLEEYQKNYLDRHARNKLSDDQLLLGHQELLQWYETMRERFEQIQETLRIMQDAHKQLFE